jgi:hypothetical protein
VGRGRIRSKMQTAIAADEHAKAMWEAVTGEHGAQRQRAEKAETALAAATARAERAEKERDEIVRALDDGRAVRNGIRASMLEMLEDSERERKRAEAEVARLRTVLRLASSAEHEASMCTLCDQSDADCVCEDVLVPDSTRRENMRWHAEMRDTIDAALAEPARREGET